MSRSRCGATPPSGEAAGDVSDLSDNGAVVAVAGTGWRLAPALIDLVAEVDTLAPDRSTASDGSIGDLAHQGRVSDHNPDDGVVHAVDITDDPTKGADVSRLWAQLVARRDPRVKYLIHDGQIWRSYPKPGLPAWTPEPYTGLNAHRSHGHISITDAAVNDGRPWFNGNDDEGDLDMTEKEVRELVADEVDKKLNGYAKRVPGITGWDHYLKVLLEAARQS